MIVTECDYQILKLTDIFFLSYPNPPYKEILKKQKRAYNCLLFQTHYDYFICIPYTSEINHSKSKIRLNDEEYGRRYKYSSLQYFHAELGI